MQLTRDSALEKLAKFGMDDMPVIEYIPNRCVIDKDWFQKYSMLRREFLASLTDSFDEIAFMNLSQEEFMNLMMGKKMPENTSLRFRIPLIWGGKLNIDNMFMCLTFPHSHNLDRFIIEQSDAKTVFLPDPAKKIYISTSSSTSSASGNATSDRITQSAAYFASGRGNE
ncbi:MAG: hypothetical protein IJL05_01895 [Alphaproteobacteria bacterium]|nr:hypothetical protein [Alphaproteobacteria bacterium]